jgi:N-acetylglucosaminyl-diphospho-decaprenol L-rhamnosyltransferase
MAPSLQSNSPQLGSWINVVIVAWNAGSDLVHSIKSICEYTEIDARKSIAVTVVDNGNNKECLSKVEELWPSTSEKSAVQVIGDGINRGFAAGCNLGARACNSRYTVVMNADVFVKPSELLRMTEILERDDLISVVGPQLRKEDGSIWRSCAYAPTLLSLALAPALGPLWSTVAMSGRFMQEWNHEEEREVDQIIGAIMCMRTMDYLNQKGFDERFFVYYEEVDYCVRVRLAGGRVVYAPSCQALHLGGSSSGSDVRRRTFYSLRSRCLYARKHFGWVSAICVAVSSIIAEGVVKPILVDLRSGLPRIPTRLLGAIDFAHWGLRYAASPRAYKALQRTE